MVIPGLVSVTFRTLAAREIVDLVVEAGLNCIEWGGDIHVPHGDTARAQEVRTMTEKAALTVASYGSYYRLAESEAQGLAFSQVAASARALAAPVVRVWAGRRASADADAAYREAVCDDFRRVAEIGRRYGFRVACEYHGGTLTDTNESARQLLAAVPDPEVQTYWQPPNGESFEYRLAGLTAIQERLAHLHVFHWKDTPEGRVREPLAAGERDWAEYLRVAGSSTRDHAALIEFVRGNSPDQFLEDAATLRRWLQPTA